MSNDFLSKNRGENYRSGFVQQSIKQLNAIIYVLSDIKKVFDFF